jgi:hypothetical protein
MSRVVVPVLVVVHRLVPGATGSGSNPTTKTAGTKKINQLVVVEHIDFSGFACATQLLTSPGTGRTLDIFSIV